MDQSNPPQKNYSLFLLLPLLMLALASLACDLEQSMGSLITGKTYTIEVKDGWEYDWSVELTAGKKYEATLALAGINASPIYSIMDVVTGVLCEECVQSVESYITTNGLSIIFTAPENGKARIKIYVREGSGKCTIQVNEIS